MKNNKITYLVIGLTVILAGVAIFTAMRLYQLRSNPVAPNAPGSEPAAQSVQDAISCEPVTFTLAASSEATGSGTFVQTTPTPTATPISSASGGTTATPTPTPTPRPTATPSTIAQATPTPTSVATTPTTTTTTTATGSANTLPDAGFTLPTFVIAAAGLLLILTAIIFAL